jgi:NAD(P)-dependent dehydrogenase (short-subunit alcohol dehydrogenase family)
MMKHTLEKAGPEIVEGIPLNRIGSPQDIAAATLWLCGKGGSYVTGTIIPIDGGYLVSPRM